MSKNTKAARREASAAESNTKAQAAAKKSKSGTMVVLTIVVVLLLTWTALAMYVNNYDGVFPNVYVDQTELSGKSPEEALALLNSTYKDANIQDLTLTFLCEGDKKELSTTDLACTFSNQETLNLALSAGKKDNMFLSAISYLGQLFGKTEITPVLSYDKDLLAGAMDEVAAPHEQKSVGHTFEIADSSVTIHGPVSGIMADRQAAIALFEQQIYRMQISDIELVPVPTEPEEIDFEEFYKWLTAPAEDAYYTKGEDGKVTVVPDKLQCTVAKDVVETAVNDLKTSANNTVTFAVTTTSPQVTAKQLTDTLYCDELGKYSTYYSGTAARNNNVQLATGRINGIELMPGEEFSYDKTILPRTAANGYQAAPVFVGNRTESGMGGGICQPSSTLYCAALYANLEIVERHNHSMLVSYLPAGLDATIAEGYLDLKFKNNTPYPIKISGQASGGLLTFSIWGYDPENISVEITRAGGGYYYTATRIVKKDGVEIKREELGSSRYSPKETETPKPTEAPKETTPPDTPEQTAPAVSDGTTTPDTPAEPAPAPAPAEPIPAPVEPEPVPAAPAPATAAPAAGSDAALSE